MNYADELYKNSPEYQRAFETGFYVCKRLVVDEIAIMLEKIAKLEPYVSTTATTETH